jgi:ketosteroid isomerase-like protein
MSQENVEIVRRLYAAIDAGDGAAVFSLYDPEVEWDSRQTAIGKLIGQTFYRGHDGIRQMARDWNNSWESVEYEIEDLIDAGQHVIAVLSYRARGRASGAEVAHTHYPVWTIQGGKIVRVAWLDTRAKALEAAGRRE